MANSGHDNSITGELKMTNTQYTAARAEIIAYYDDLLAPLDQKRDGFEIKVLQNDLKTDLRRLDNTMLAAAEN
jgi:hypothetical protein